MATLAYRLGVFQNYPTDPNSWNRKETFIATALIQEITVLEKRGFM